MKAVKVAIGAALIVGIAALLYAHFLGPKYGISPKQRLGTQPEIEKVLVGKLKFEKQDLGKGLYQYDDTKSTGENRVDTWVRVLVDDQGRVIGVHGRCLKPPPKDPLNTRHPTYVFLKRFWDDAGGPAEREWKTIHGGNAYFDKSFDYTTFTRKGVTGAWVKNVWDTGPTVYEIWFYLAAASGTGRFHVDDLK